MAGSGSTIHEPFSRFRIVNYLMELWVDRPYSVYHGVEVNRCRPDRMLVTPKSDLKMHGGHFMDSPVCLTAWEKTKIWMGMIR